MMVVFYFKQKTAYEMRISDWISDLCSSDLVVASARVDLVELDQLATAAAHQHQQGDKQHGQRLESDASHHHLVLLQAGCTRPLLSALQVLLSCPEERDDTTHQGNHGRNRRSEERRLGKECASTCRSRRSPYH